MKKKLLAIFIAGVMTCGALTGCGDSGSKTASSPAPAKTTEAAKDTTDEAKKDTSATDAKKQEVIQVPVTIVNTTDIEFSELYTSGAGIDNWGESILGAGVKFGAGTAVKTAFNVDANNLKWDFKAVDSAGDSIEFQGLDLSNCNTTGVTVKLSYDRDTKTGTITAE